MTYQTQPGTIPHRVVEWLKAHPGEEPSSHLLCAELDVEPAGFVNLMLTARRNGALKSRTIKGRGKVLHWSLGDGTPVPPEDVDDPLPRRSPPAAVRPGPLFPGIDVNTTPAHDFNAALFLDGSLILVGVQQRGDGAVVLSPEQTQRLRARMVEWVA